MTGAMDPEKVLVESKSVVLPVFVSYLDNIKLDEEHADIKTTVCIMNDLWQNYQKTVQGIENNLLARKRQENMEEICDINTIATKEIYKKQQEEMEELLRSLNRITNDVKKYVKVLGCSIDNKISIFEKSFLNQRMNEFIEIRDKVCKSIFYVLNIDAANLSSETREILSGIESKLYTCFLKCECANEKRFFLEKSWIPLHKYALLKSLYTHAYFNIQEYLLVYKRTEIAIRGQNNIMDLIEEAIDRSKDALLTLKQTLVNVPILMKKQIEYKKKTPEEQVIYHESSILQKKETIEEHLARHKSAMQHIDHLNWEVGKEVKNIKNIEIKKPFKKDMSIKKLFSLLESLQASLKKIEYDFVSANKLVVNAKKSITIQNHLFSIKSLNFKYFMMQGNLLSLHEDVNTVYQMSKAIYTGHLKKNRSHF